MTPPWRREVSTMDSKTRTYTWSTVAAVALLAIGVGCKDSSGPGDGLFPALPSDLLAAFCARGEAVVGQTKSGTITDDDCDAADIDPADSSFYEIWRVRVTESRSVTFDANSPFDNYLTVVRLDSYTQSSANLTLIGENDDRTPGSDLNALVTVTLNPDTDYFVSVSGYDYDETGPYTLQIR
ncbi:MAG: hypothetical protein ACREME_09130 [Gemmatimonadales bacterium]